MGEKGATSNLEREDFDAGPANLDNIEENLWLGMFLTWKNDK